MKKRKVVLSSVMTGLLLGSFNAFATEGDVKNEVVPCGAALVPHCQLGPKFALPGDEFVFETENGESFQVRVITKTPEHPEGVETIHQSDSYGGLSLDVEEGAVYMLYVEYDEYVPVVGNVRMIYPLRTNPRDLCDGYPVNTAFKDSDFRSEPWGPNRCVSQFIGDFDYHVTTPFNVDQYGYIWVAGEGCDRESCYARGDVHLYREVDGEWKPVDSEPYAEGGKYTADVYGEVNDYLFIYSASNNGEEKPFVPVVMFTNGESGFSRHDVLEPGEMLNLYFMQSGFHLENYPPVKVEKCTLLYDLQRCMSGDDSLWQSVSNGSKVFPGEAWIVSNDKDKNVTVYYPEKAAMGNYEESAGKIVEDIIIDYVAVDPVPTDGLGGELAIAVAENYTRAMVYAYSNLQNIPLQADNELGRAIGAQAKNLAVKVYWRTRIAENKVARKVRVLEKRYARYGKLGASFLRQQTPELELNNLVERQQ